ETDANGRFKLTRLVKNLGSADQYRVRVSTPEGGLLYYETAFLTYAQGWPLFGPQGDGASFNEQYTVTRTDTLVVKLVPKLPRLTGQLLRSDTKTPIVWGRTDLCHNYVCIKHYVDSLDSGHFTFSNIDTSAAAQPYRLDVGSVGFIPQSRDSLP